MNNRKRGRPRKDEKLHLASVSASEDADFADDSVELSDLDISLGRASLSQAAKLLGKDRNTIAKYVEKGMPFLQKADKATGKPWIFYIPHCVKWLEEQAASAAASAAGGSDNGGLSEGEGKRRKVIAQAVIAELRASESMRSLVPFSFVVDTVGKEYMEVRQRLMALPDYLSSRVDADYAPVIRKIADEQVRDVLSSLRVDIDHNSALAAVEDDDDEFEDDEE